MVSRVYTTVIRVTRNRVCRACPIAILSQKTNFPLYFIFISSPTQETPLLVVRNRPPRSTPAAHPQPHTPVPRGCSSPRGLTLYLERARLRGLDAAEEEVLALVRVRASCSLG